MIASLFRPLLSERVGPKFGYGNRFTLPASILAKLLYSKPAPWSGDWEATSGDWEATSGDTDLSAHKLPGKTDASYAAVYAAVNDGSGFWYDSNGNPVARLLADILADGQTNQWLIWCSIHGRLMIFNNTLTDAEMIKVRVYLGLGREELPPDIFMGYL